MNVATAGFHTTGTMILRDGNFVGRETVKGEAGGITEVEATGELLPDGRMRSTSRYLKKGEWVPGHEILYEEAPKAKVVFR